MTFYRLLCKLPHSDLFFYGLIAVALVGISFFIKTPPLKKSIIHLNMIYP